MASIQFGNGVAQIRGSINGTTFARNKNGAYARNRVKGVNPRTQAQVSQRLLLSSISSAWRDLTIQERQTWIDGAKDFPYANRVGEVSVLSGAQLHTKLNLQLLSAGKSVLTACPTPQVLPTVEAGNASCIVDAGVLQDFTFDLTKEPLAAGLSMQVFASNGVSAGRTTNSTTKRLLGTIDGSGQTSLDIAPLYVGVYASPSVGSNVIVELRVVVDATGQSFTSFAGAVPVVEQAP
jgi:hypothetical protein